MITYDPPKRLATLKDRGLDFEAAEAVFRGPTFDRVDDRAEYGEVRIITAGLLSGRMVIIGWTPRGGDRHVFSMRKANGREQARFRKLLR